MGIRWCQKAGVSIKRIQISSQWEWNQYEQDTDLYATEHQHYIDERSLYRERSQSVEYQKVNPNVHHSCVVDREKPDSKFDKSLACQESEESNEDKNRKSENFEKIQSLLQTIGLNLDTAEVSKLADRTQERLYGKTKKLIVCLLTPLNKKESDQWAKLSKEVVVVGQIHQTLKSSDLFPQLSSQIVRFTWVIRTL